MTLPRMLHGQVTEKLRVAAVPMLALSSTALVLAMLAASALAQAQQAGDDGRATHLPLRARRRIAPIGFDEASVDEQVMAIRRAQGREHPEARTALGHGLHECLALMQELTGDAHRAVFVVRRIDASPRRCVRRRDRLRVHARLDAFDQV